MTSYVYKSVFANILGELTHVVHLRRETIVANIDTCNKTQNVLRKQHYEKLKLWAFITRVVDGYLNT